jgi:hypothetical protein
MSERGGWGERGGCGDRRSIVAAALAGACILAGAPAGARAQQVRTAVLPDTATVGDVVRAAVWVHLPTGWRVAFADSLAASDTLENAGKRLLTERPGQRGGVEVAATYPVTPWRTGNLSLPSVRLRVVGPGVDSVIEARFPRLHVHSVLPADTTKQQPKPPRDVLGADRLLWPYILAALLALLLLALLAWWLWRRRRRRAAVVVAPIEDALAPRDRAIRELDRARAAGLLESGEVKAFYCRSTDAVRRYLAELDPAWGADRTTSELIPRLRALDLGVAAALARLLDRSDLVKFARLRPSQGEAFSDWAELRRWVESFPEPHPAESEPARGAEVRAA